MLLKFLVPTVKISYTKLLIRLGYLHAKTKLTYKIACLIKENLNLAQKLIVPKVTVVFENVMMNQEFVSFKDGYEIVSSNVANLLKNSFKAYGVGITIGGALEKRRDEFFKKKATFNALIMDAAGSVAAEETMMLVNMQIKFYEEKLGNALTKRYSPGYGDWILDDNRNFLNWIDAESIGIDLNESCHMKPEKSISALIGVIKNIKDIK
ncbi:MAG: hypothetical protein LBS47_01435 [Endomicrobium sp.]|jgi:hypothetical protein|nr:hypothetical protein [Endomicrobium sp.]